MDPHHFGRLHKSKKPDLHHIKDSDLDLQSSQIQELWRLTKEPWRLTNGALEAHNGAVKDMGANGCRCASL